MIKFVITAKDAARAMVVAFDELGKYHGKPNIGKAMIKHEPIDIRAIMSILDNRDLYKQLDESQLDDRTAIIIAIAVKPGREARWLVVVNEGEDND